MYVGGQVRPLRLFEVLARNRQSALGLSGCTRSAQERPHRMFTIPPRQQLSITIWLAIRRRNVIRLGSRTLALINPKACTTTYIRKREKRAFLTFFEKTLTSSYETRLSHFHSHTHTKSSIDRSIHQNPRTRGCIAKARTRREEERFPRKRSQLCLRAKPTRYSFR